MKKILLVDADKKILQKLGKRLEKAGYEVNTASDGSGALESALLEKPDLIIANYHLPLFDAERLRAFLKHNPTTTHIPFIYLIDADRSHEEILASIGGDAFLVKPFRWQDIRELIDSVFEPTSKTSPPELPPGTGIEGSLKEVSLVDLLQIFGLNRRTGTLTLQYNDDSGTIHLLDGTVVSAVQGETDGEKALYRILRWPKGTFRYHPGETAFTRNISRSMDALLMEGMRQLDEWSSIYHLMPPPNTVLKLAKKREELPQDMRPVTQEVLLLQEFYNTAEEIVEKATHTDYDVCKSLLGLIQKGILVPLVDEKVQARKEEPLIDPDLLIQMHKVLKPARGDISGSCLGKVLVFSSQPEQLKLLLSRITDVEGFRLSKDNFSNQEVINAAFGTAGVLEFSDNAYLQIFLLPSSEKSVPLWRSFSGGTLGSFFLGNPENNEDRTLLERIQDFMERELNKPLILANPDDMKDNETGNPGIKIFRELFSALMTKYALSGESQA
jgi:CheY-like chemotaxis protein